MKAYKTTNKTIAATHKAIWLLFNVVRYSAYFIGQAPNEGARLPTNV